jgi:anthranilate phosphoribosyltransferase
MSGFPALLRRLIARGDLEAATIRAAIGEIMDGEWTSAQSGAFLTALAMKGETPAELAGAARAMRERSLRVEHSLPVVVDIVGTGGDLAGTINVSTCAAFAIASCGLPVAKHGNRAASSKCGSADVVEALDIPLDLTGEPAREALEVGHWLFLFAQRYHPAMKAVAPTRRELGVRTVFNLLGPLSNPAGATHLVVGVSNPAHVELVGGALAELGAKGGAIVHAANGLDEIAGDAPTDVYQFAGGNVRRWRIDPADYGIRVPLAEITGGEPAENARALRSILEGERSGRSEVVALNAALALVVAERAESVAEALEVTRASLRSGAALAVYETARRRREKTFA